MKSKVDGVLTIANLFATKNLVENVYIHLPFCKKKCHFCAFPVHAIGQQPQTELLSQYIQALKQEIRLSLPVVSLSNQLKTLYFGGGTPSLHSHQQFSSILGLLPTTKETQITAEVNPTQISSIQGLMDIGINRISLGVQSFNTSILQAIGRHAPDNSLPFIMKGIEKCRPPNLNVDFILNFCASQVEWEEMLHFIKQVLPEHLTIYMLEINEGSKIFDQPALLSQLPPEETVVNRYVELCQLLKGIGYEHYEISNFSRGAKYRSRHSSTYWEGNKQYLAFGMGATSLNLGRRTTRPRTITKYIQYTKLLELGSISQDYLEIEEEANIKERLSAIILSGIRTSAGINWKKLQTIDQSGVYIQKIKACLQKLCEDRSEIISIVHIDEGIRLLSPYGFLLGDEIAYRLISAIQDCSS